MQILTTIFSLQQIKVQFARIIAFLMRLISWSPYIVICMIKHPLNCWDILTLNKLQRKDEIYLNVKVAKAEKIIKLIHGQILTII